MNNNNGFTVLELLIAVTMLAVIAGIITGTLNMTHRSIAKGEKKIHDLERTRSSVSLAEAQLQSMFPFFYNDESDQRKILFFGQKDKIMFYSKYSLWAGAKGYVLVDYTVKTDDKGKQHLAVTEKRMGLEKTGETILFEGCEKIYFEFFLKNAVEEGKWVEEWPADEKGLPEKIKIYTFTGAKKSVLVAGIWTKPTTITATAVPVISQ